MLDIKITRTTSPKEKPQDESKLGFGKTGNLPGLPRPPLLGEVAKPIGFDGEV